MTTDITPLGTTASLGNRSESQRTAERAELGTLRRRNKQLQAELKHARLALQSARETHALLEILWACHSIGANPASYASLQWSDTEPLPGWLN
jgi:hypothetical protein